MKTKGSNKAFDLNRAKGFFLMVFSAIMTTCMNLIIKYQAAHTSVNVIQAVVIRSLFLAMGSYIHLSRDKRNIIDIPPRLWKYIILRGTFGFISSISFYTALDYLPLSSTVTIYYV